MTFDIQRVTQSKNAKRRELAAMPIEKKLQMLDALRERTVALRSASRPSKRIPPVLLHEAQVELKSK